MGSQCGSLRSILSGSKKVEPQPPGCEPENGPPDAAEISMSTPTAHAVTGRTCSRCQQVVEEYAKGARGELLCRACLRVEDERLLEPISPEERCGLDMLAKVLDCVSWKYWKPGQQPAKLLEWLYIGDLQEAMDFEQLKKKGIGAVLNLIHWWELQARHPEVADFQSLYAEHGMDFMEADSEDTLFCNIVEDKWPAASEFLMKCRTENRRVLVNCKAGHNRSACICVCWLMVRENVPLLEAVEIVQTRRGTILSNHGFRLQLVRLALSLGRLGQPAKPVKLTLTMPTIHSEEDEELPVDDYRQRRLANIIMKKRLHTKYTRKSKEQSSPLSILTLGTLPSAIGEEVIERISQRAIKTELLACLYHRHKKFSEEYEYTSDPPTVVGSGFSGDVVQCRRRARTAVSENVETSVRCVKSFDLRGMKTETLDKLKNEAAIYLSLEHPHIARLFDVFEDQEEVNLVMQYCSGGTLEDSLKANGAYSEERFKDAAVGMLMAVNYIHKLGIIHRDIKPQNWVYEADGATVKLIDFGFSVKDQLNTKDSLKACLGTLGYIAPEVVRTGVSSEASYTEKCDIWSLGVVFLELLTGKPAFHKDAGMCDGYTEEVVLREIELVTEEGIAALLRDAPQDARAFIRSFLTKDPAGRPSAYEALMDPYLQTARDKLVKPPTALNMDAVLERFQAHGRQSKTTRAWVLAVARAPTYLPWTDFCCLRETFMMFDVYGLNGTVNLDTFLSVVMASVKTKDIATEDVRRIWYTVCGVQDSLSYCEFLAAILPHAEDVFEDCLPQLDEQSSEDDIDKIDEFGRQFSTDSVISTRSIRSRSENVRRVKARKWDPALPISSYFHIILTSQSKKALTFSEDCTVKEVVEAMSENHQRWVVVQYKNGRREFFDYMDINHFLVELQSGNGDNMPAAAGEWDDIENVTSGFDRQASDVMGTVMALPVGKLANCSEHCAFVPMQETCALRAVLNTITGLFDDVRRVPIVDHNGKLLHIFSCLDFLQMALRFKVPTAILKSCGARTFDRRDTMYEASVLVNENVLTAMKIMASEHLTICPATSRELSGDLGGVVAVNVISVADLKWVISTGKLEMLDKSVEEFISWRSTFHTTTADQTLRQERLQRFNVVSVHAGSSLYTLARRLLASKLQRIFLSSDEIARIVGIVSSSDILREVADQLM